MNPSALLRAQGVRSKLFVPCSRPALFSKAFLSPADAISFDLEDSVASEDKDEARDSLTNWFASHASPTDKFTIVRTNQIQSRHFEADVEAAISAGMDAINVPKISSAGDVRKVDEALSRIEGAGGQFRTSVILNIESARGLQHAAEIAQGSSRTVALQLGFGDLFMEMGITAPGAGLLSQIRFNVRCAAAVAGVAVYDGASGDVNDEEKFRADALVARDLGFSGKSCIHPRQVIWANAVFSRSGDALAEAVRLLTARNAQSPEKRGAFVFDGSLVDEAHFQQAQAIVDAHPLQTRNS